MRSELAKPNSPHSECLKLPGNSPRETPVNGSVNVIFQIVDCNILLFATELQLNTLQKTWTMKWLTV